MSPASNRLPRTRGVHMASLLEDDEKTDDLAEQGYSFDQRRGDDHVGAYVADGLRLAGNALHGSVTDEADADTGSDCSEPGSDTGSQKC